MGSRQPAAAGGAGAGKMWLPVLVWVAVAQGSAKPLGALQGVEWEARQLPSVSGAPHSFSLFYPELPRSRAATTTRSSTSTTTSNPRLASTSTREKDIPLIHFNEEASLGGQNYFDFFPQELLEGSPYKIRVIEHEDFIDYEIEFVEMSDEEEEKEEEEYQYEYYNEEEAFDPSPADAGLTSGFGITFMDLLERARQQHQVTTNRPENPKRGRQGVTSRAHDRPQGGPGRSTASPVLGQVSTTLDKLGAGSRQLRQTIRQPA